MWGYGGGQGVWKRCGLTQHTASVGVWIKDGNVSLGTWARSLRILGRQDEVWLEV